jgi:hypothetical protein
MRDLVESPLSLVFVREHIPAIRSSLVETSIHQSEARALLRSVPLLEKREEAQQRFPKRTGAGRVLFRQGCLRIRQSAAPLHRPSGRRRLYRRFDRGRVRHVNGRDFTRAIMRGKEKVRPWL